MSEADKMFEELGYKKIEDRYNIDFNKIYSLIGGHKYKEQIRFYKLDKCFYIECYNYNDETIFGRPLDMEELQAIYLKCKELGWI